jgi:hypothetical protein
MVPIGPPDIIKIIWIFNNVLYLRGGGHAVRWTTSNMQWVRGLSIAQLVSETLWALPCVRLLSSNNRTACLQHHLGTFPWYLGITWQSILCPPFMKQHHLYFHFVIKLRYSDSSKNQMFPNCVQKTKTPIRVSFLYPSISISCDNIIQINFKYKFKQTIYFFDIHSG